MNLAKKYSISFVLPFYNEGKNARKCVLSCLCFAEKYCKDYEIIMVNDGSQDDTFKICRDLLINYDGLYLVEHKKNLGIGAALYSGFKKARKEYIFYMDGDNQYDVSILVNFLPYLSNFNLLLGWRRKRSDPYFRKIYMKLYHLVLRILFDMKFRDIDCGFKIFSRSSFQNISLKSQGAFFIAEFLYKMKKAGARIKEIPINHYPRLFGKQTGAKFSVVSRIMQEMLIFFFIRN